MKQKDWNNKHFEYHFHINPTLKQISLRILQVQELHVVSYINFLPLSCKRQSKSTDIYASNLWPMVAIFMVASASYR